MRSKARASTSVSTVVERPWVSRMDLEQRALSALRRFPGFEDVTAVDVEPAETGGIGGWAVARVWRQHLVELPVGPAWDAGGAAAVDNLRCSFRLDPRSRWGRG